MGKIDVKKLKKSLSLAHHKQIMQALGIPSYSENSTQIVYYTGDKNVDPYKGSPKLYFYKDTSIYVGMTAGRSYDIISLTQTRLALLKQPCSFLDACQFILDTTNINPDSISRIKKEGHVYDWSNLEKFIKIRKYGSALKEYPRLIIDTLPAYFPDNWYDEGISESTMEKYQIRYYERCNQTVIPCFDEEARLIGVRIRNWDEDKVAEAKYMPLITLDGTCYKFNTNQVFYGINYNRPMIEQTGEVWLGESEKFVLKMDTWYGDKSCALGMYGHQLGIQRRNQLLKMGVKHVIYVPDNDWIGKDDEAFDAWCKSVRSLCDLFKGFCDVDIVWDDSGELLGPKDNATDRDKATWERLFNNREKYL